MEPSTIAIIARKELRDAWRNRWFLLLTVAFGGLAVLLSVLGRAALGQFGVTGFGRTAASLLHLVMILVPLMGLLMGALSVAVEREHGTLLTLMAQPVTAGEVLVGKFLGSAAAVVGAILLGFGTSAVVIGGAAGPAAWAAFSALTGWTVALAVAQLAMGFLLSAFTRRGTTALGAALACWLLLVLVSDLGIMSTAIALRLNPGQLLWTSLTNPIQVFRLAAIGTDRVALDSLGPAGRYAADALGPWLFLVAAALLTAWTLLPLWGAWRLLRRRGALG